jgi:HEAT repeat protein
MSFLQNLFPPNVRKLAAKGDIEGLGRALGWQRDERVRRAAARYLSESGDPRAVEPLISATRDQDFTVRHVAIEALGKTGDPKAIRCLVSFLGEREEISTSACLALVESGEPAVEALMEALKNKKKRELAALALGLIGSPAIQALIEALKHQDEPTRRNALYAVGVISDEQGIAPHVTDLEDEEEESVRFIAIRKLKKKVGTHFVEALLSVACRDKDADIRSQALAVLKKIKDGRIAGFLIAALQDEDAEVRSNACTALIEYLPDHAEAAEALGKCGDSRAVQPLIKELQSQNWGVRQAAARALLRFYQAGQLAETERQAILAQRKAILAPHRDGYSDAECQTPDKHSDNGIGIEFPL